MYQDPSHSEMNRGVGQCQKTPPTAAEDGWHASLAVALPDIHTGAASKNLKKNLKTLNSQSLVWYCSDGVAKTAWSSLKSRTHAFY